MLNTSNIILSRANVAMSDLFPVSDINFFNSALQATCPNLDSKFLLAVSDDTHEAALKLNKAYESKGVKSWADIRKVAEAIETKVKGEPVKITELWERWGTSRGRDTEGYTTFSLTDSYNVIEKRILEVGGGYDMRSAGLAHWLELFLKSEDGTKHLNHLASNVNKLIWSQSEVNVSSQEHVILSQIPYALTMYRHKEYLQNLYESFDHKQKALSACADSVEFLIKNTKSFSIGRGYGVDAVELVALLAGIEILPQGKFTKRNGWVTTHHIIRSTI